MPPSCALLGGFAIGARVSLLMRNVCEYSCFRSAAGYGYRILSIAAVEHTRKLGGLDALSSRWHVVVGMRTVLLSRPMHTITTIEISVVCEQVRVLRPVTLKAPSPPPQLQCIVITGISSVSLSVCP